MIEVLTTMLSGLHPNDAANVVLVLLAVGLVLSLRYSWKDPHGFFGAYSPTILTTLGILGTFIGITIGLVNFDHSTHETIDESIPSLLGGLTMAFVTSIVGLASSIVVRMTVGYRSKKIDDEAIEEVSAKDVYNVMKAQRDYLNQIRVSIAGDVDSSVVTQLQKVRTDMNDGLKELEKTISGGTGKSVSEQLADINNNMDKLSEEIKIELRDFSSQISEMATKQIIEALSEVIRNFNENLTEQFGDNFKQLNQAVEKLVAWQDEYRQQMIDTKSALDASVEAVRSAADSLDNIRDNAQAIPPVMKTLEEVLEVLGTELSDLQNHIESFSRIKDKAEEALPAISQNIENITGLVQKTVEEANNAHYKFVNETSDLVDWITTYLKDTANELADQDKEVASIMKEASKEVQKTATSIQEQGERIVQDLGKSFKESAANMNEQLKNMIEEQGREVNRLSESLRQEMQKAAREREEALSKEINELITKMDEALQQELQRAMQGMANHLGAIAKKFTEDYGELTDRMKEVVNQSRNFKS